MISTVVRVFNILHITLVLVAKILLITMVLIIFSNVVLRYGFNSGIQWSEEIGLLIAVWFSFIAMVVGVKQNLHIHINLLPEQKLSPGLNRVLKKVSDLTILTVGYVFLRWGWVLVGFTMRSILPASHLPAGWLYMIMPICAVFLIYDGITDFFEIDTDDETVDAYLSGQISLTKALEKVVRHKGGSDA